ncbi:hypothetical protein ACIQV2_15605 [Streptomyces globosus]|uniref:hypothetical protein n=1 Tax=Streptomyces globosus TaxID=68209 RepID=UPI0038276AE1
MKVSVGYAAGVALLATSKAVELGGDRWDSAASWAQVAVITAATAHVAISGVDRLINITQQVRKVMRFAAVLDEDNKANGTDAGAA